MVKNNKITLVGAGPVGSLLALFLAKKGYQVEIFERRPDMRIHGVSGGRSINLAVSTRGLFALEQVGLKSEILDHAIPMRGRMMHSRAGELSFQRYGRDDNEFINSVSRGELNKALMTAAEKTGQVKIHFSQRVSAADLKEKNLMVEDEKSRIKKIPYDVLIGTDGSASVVRGELMKMSGTISSEERLDYGYKEFHIPPGDHGEFLMEKNSLHIWPRGRFMLIALPNSDGSFTATLFLPQKGEPSFENLKNPSDVRDLFTENFKDVLEKMPRVLEDFSQHPVGHMVTVKCYPWTDANQGSVMLLGDAAHAIVPFFGQGMNCGFEDCTVLNELLDSKDSSWAEVFEIFQTKRKENCDAIAEMATENFVEMRDKVGNKKFLLQKEVEQVLQKKFPEKYVSRYAMVTFSRVPYTKALNAGVEQLEILEKICRNIDRIEDVDWLLAERLVEEMKWI